jgi:cell division protein FtsI (penicillin-binding protein 3)
MLKGVVREGTGAQAQINGYLVAGKTGTAQKFDRVLRKYTSKAHLAVFVGFVPADNPVLSMIIVIDQPQGKYYGGDVAAPVFKEIGTLVLRHMGIPKKMDLIQPIITAGLRSSGRE